VISLFGTTVRQDYRLRKIARLASGRGSLLDIGCSGLPNMYLRAGIVTGFDSVSAVMPSNYTGFIIGDALHLSESIQNQSYDVIVAAELLEHLEEPVSFLRQCRSILKDGGLLVLSTPNPNSPIERILTLTMSRRYFYTSEHVCIYPQRWLVRMMEIAGFGGIRLHSGGFPVPLTGLVPFPRPWCHQTIATGLVARR